MAIKADYIWMDGELVPWEQAQVHVMTHTLHYGLGVFEGIRAYDLSAGGAAVFRLDAHMKRMVESAKICRMELPYTQAELEAAAVEIARANGGKGCYIRPLAYLGDGQMGLGALNLPVRVMIAAWEWGAYLGDESAERGIRLCTSSFTRPHVNATMVKGKIVGQYVNSILAKREALENGYDEAVLLDPQGFVSEASGENIFMVRDGIIWTTPTTGTILEGVTRASLIELARDLGMTVREERFTRDFLWSADEVFLCGTAAELTPVREIDRRTIGEGSRGPVTQRLQEAFFGVVKGEDARYSSWLTQL